MLCPRCGQDGATKNGGGRTYHAACGKYGVYRKDGAEPNVALEARKGFAPEHGLNTPYPDGYMMGKVTIQRDADGNIVNTWERMCSDHERQLEVLNIAARAILDEVTPVAPTKATRRSYVTNCAAAYPIGDPHVGMYSWGEETGEDWDLNIAERMHCDAMTALVNSAPATETGYIVNLGDLFHYDSLEPKTSRSGHVLDADSRYHKMIRVGCRIMRFCIEAALSKHKFVHVVNVKGNHDDIGAVWLSELLAQVYENEPRVSIDTKPGLFNFIRFGKTLVGLNHGTVKPGTLAGVMAADRARDWGECEFRYWWIGHVHHEGVKEYAGVTVESFNTLAAKDAYAYNAGYRARRNMKCIVLHETEGEVARFTVNPNMFKSAA